MIEFRMMRLCDFFRMDFRETDPDAFTGDSVFVNCDRCVQGRINHHYQRFCLLLKLLFGVSPIDYMVFIAADDDEPVGVIWIRVRGNSAFMGMFVKPNYRRRGIASSLMGMAADYADMHKIKLEAFYHDKNPAVKVALKAGFKVHSNAVKLVRGMK